MCVVVSKVDALAVRLKVNISGSMHCLGDREKVSYQSWDIQNVRINNRPV